MYSGDIIGPSTVNLFRRALNQDPLVPDLNNILPSTIIHSGPEGEAELLINQYIIANIIRTDDEDGNKDPKDKVGNDLNNIVMLLMAKLRFASVVSDQAVRVYVTERPHTYGSYLGSYYALYGSDMSNLVPCIQAGIAHGWQPDVSAPYGAVRWYHRPSVGANPQLATLYSVIIDKFIK